jgi:NAD-dependent SIR2 family protein deacetylase
MQTGLASKIPAELRQRFKESQRAFVLTGAGISAESGVPTFRGGGKLGSLEGPSIRGDFLSPNGQKRSASRLGVV